MFKNLISKEGCNCSSSGALQSLPMQATNAKNNSSAKFTYDEGEGQKELIVLTGPLSQAYTDALNIYFEKKPITGEFDEVVNDAELTGQEKTALAQSNIASGVANETQANDETILTGLIRELKYVDAGNDLPKYYDFKNDSQVFDSVQPNSKPVNIVEIVDPETLAQTDYINKVQERQPNPYTRFIYLVQAKNKGEMLGACVVKRLVNVQDVDPLINYLTEIDEIHAFEHLKDCANAKFVFGLKGLIDHLKDRIES